MKKPVLFLLSACLIFPALALTPEQIAQQQQIIIQQQQEQARQYEEQRREVREAERIRKTRVDSGMVGNQTGATANTAVGECPTFGTIKILGNKTYSDRRIKKIRCLKE